MSSLKGHTGRTKEEGLSDEKCRINFIFHILGARMTYLAWLIFIGAAILEVGGDAVVRKGLRGSSLMIILAGCAMLGSYGVVVNTVKWDFSKLLGVYVAIFAVVSILFGRLVFEERIPNTTWVGLIVIVCGAMIIQFGKRM